MYKYWNRFYNILKMLMQSSTFFINSKSIYSFNFVIKVFNLFKIPNFPLPFRVGFNYNRAYKYVWKLERINIILIFWVSSMILEFPMCGFKQSSSKCVTLPLDSAKNLLLYAARVERSKYNILPTIFFQQVSICKSVHGS